MEGNFWTQLLTFDNVIKFIERLGSLGLLFAIVAGSFYFLIKVYPELQRQMDAGKKERAQMHTDAIKQLAEYIGNQSKEIINQGEEIRQFGIKVTELISTLIKIIEPIQDKIGDINTRCIKHGETLAVMNDRTKRRTKNEDS